MAKGPIFAAGLALAASTHCAQAVPAGPADLGQDSLVTTVAQGCGRGWERNRWGECRPMRRGPPVYGGPAVVMPGVGVVAPGMMRARPRSSRHGAHPTGRLADVA